MKLDSLRSRINKLRNKLVNTGHNMSNMYKVLDIDAGEVTRYFTMQNMQTGEIFECFDDSDVLGNNEFKFLKVGECYDCKILLFSDEVEKSDDRAVKCKLVKYLTIGVCDMLEVEVDGTIYYLMKSYLKSGKDHSDGIFYVFPIRKDLIEVNGIVHGDMLRHHTWG